MPFVGPAVEEAPFGDVDGALAGAVGLLAEDAEGGGGAAVGDDLDAGEDGGDFEGGAVVDGDASDLGAAAAVDHVGDLVVAGPLGGLAAEDAIEDFHRGYSQKDLTSGAMTMARLWATMVATAASILLEARTLRGKMFSLRSGLTSTLESIQT